MSKDSFYFSHDYNSRSDPKIKKLILRHKMEGYGIFWSIVEDLYNNANALPLDYDCIAFDLHTDSELIKSIINNFDLFVIEDNVFGSMSVQRRIDNRNSKSAKARESAFKRWNKNQPDANAMRTQCECNAIKEIKGKEIKGNNISKLPSKSADFIDQIIDCFVTEHGNYEILNRGKERAAASKLLQQYHKKFPAANSEETLHALKTYFSACVKIDDNWLRENMSLPIIISKFNQINTILRNGKLRGHSSKASDNSTVEDIVRSQGKKMGLITE